MKKLAFSFKGFPFHIHFRGYHEHPHRDKFTLYWATKEKYFGNPDREDVVSEIDCQIVGLHDGALLLSVKALPRKKHLGQERPDVFGERDWYKQEWRQDRYLVEASAVALWTILENNADFERAVKDVMSA